MIEDMTTAGAAGAESTLAEAVAAHLAGDIAKGNDWRQALAACLEASLVETQLLIALATASFVVPSAGAAQAGRMALLVLRPIVERDGIATKLAEALASAADHLAQGLAGRPAADLGEPTVRDALDLAASVSQRLRQERGSGLQT
jgi:hypothetical protein